LFTPIPFVTAITRRKLGKLFPHLSNRETVSIQSLATSIPAKYRSGAPWGNILTIHDFLGLYDASNLDRKFDPDVRSEPFFQTATGYLDLISRQGVVLIFSRFPIISQCTLAKNISYRDGHHAIRHCPYRRKRIFTP
jgi:hypothetical protein